MIVKDDLVHWFRNLESYRRIDIMCTLLNLCLPFELRFLGTCLEELGRRDAQDLRCIELRVNNPAEFVNDVGSFQAGQPTEVKVRRKMAMYLALMRACNRTGVNELFKTLDRWGDRDFTKFSDGDPLQELLLVYTMATNHPVFSFEQRLKCGEIFMKITSSKSHLNQQSPVTTSPITTPLTSSTFSVQQHQPTSPPPFANATFQQPAAQIINPQISNPPLLMAFPAATAMSPMIADPNTTLALSVESLAPHSIGVAPAIMQIPTDFTSPPPNVGAWQMRYPAQIFPAMVSMDSSFPPQASSPHMSQPSSPTHSRPSSPTRSNQQPPSQVQPQMMPNPVVSQIQTQSTHRNNRPLRNTRPSSETTPPPLQQPPPSHQPASQGSATIYMNQNNDIMVQTIKNFEDINMEGAITQLQSLQRNGFNRAINTIPRHSNKHNWTAVHAGPPSYNLHMIDPASMPSSLRKSTVGSDSGGSSTGEASPPPMQPDAAGLHGNANQTQSSGSLRKNQPLNLSRLNGDFNNGSQATLVTSASSGNLPLLIGGQMQPFPGYRIPTHHQRPFQTQPNGELVYTFNPPFLTTQQPVVNCVSQRASPTAVPVPTPYPTNKMVQSCFNCGSTSHTGLNCSEASMEDVTRNAVYKLDYTASAPVQLQFMTQQAANQMTTSSSSSSLNLATIASNPMQPVNNNEPDQQIPFIDLTQDTSSSSSSSTSSIHGAK